MWSWWLFELNVQICWIQSSNINRSDEESLNLSKYISVTGFLFQHLVIPCVVVVSSITQIHTHSSTRNHCLPRRSKQLAMFYVAIFWYSAYQTQKANLQPHIDILVLYKVKCCCELHHF